MSINILHTVFTWILIIAAFLSAFSSIGVWWTGKIIDNKKTEEIQILQKTVVNMQPRIFSQLPVSLNVQDGNLFRQTYKISVNSPNSNMVIYTTLSSIANRVGKLDSNLTGEHGVRKQDGLDVSFSDYIFTFLTDKEINIDTDTVKFLTQNQK